MSTPNKPIHRHESITGFYSDALKNFGDSSKGVGWKNDQAQDVRFEQLAKVITIKSDFTVNDLGCGTGKFYKFLLDRGYQPSVFQGYDILDEMVEAAKKALLPDAAVKIAKITAPSEMTMADYSVESGIFNVKYDAKESEWLHNVLSTIEAMNEKSRLGFAFNMLTKYSDKEFMQSYLYYADPAFMFDYCKRNFSKNVALLHDYDQYDFTILVRKNPQ
ncbi:MAG: class I SAM-dependent methyltransferase [Bacteroidota bacterium]